MEQYQCVVEVVHIVDEGLEVLDGLQGEGQDIPLVVGGIVPDEDAVELRDRGVARIYTPKDYDVIAIVSDMVDVVSERLDAA